MNDAATTNRPEPQRAEPRPHPLTPAMQQLMTLAALCIAFLALCVAVFGIVYTVWTAQTRANDRLVAVGVSVLRVDPKKETQITAAREWALDLIDANAGGVKFKPEARQSLLQNRLDVDSYADYGSADIYPNYSDYPRPKVPRPSDLRPKAEPMR